jgi:hypothetical protein
MMGDAHDLSLVLQWAQKRFWEDMEDPDNDGNLLEWPFPQEVRLEVAESLVDLCRCFDNAEQAHRKEFQLTGNKADTKVSSSKEVRVSAGVNQGFGSVTSPATRRFLRLVAPNWSASFLLLEKILTRGTTSVPRSSCVCCQVMTDTCPGRLEK